MPSTAAAHIGTGPEDTRIADRLGFDLDSTSSATTGNPWCAAVASTLATIRARRSDLELVRKSRSAARPARRGS